MTKMSEAQRTAILYVFENRNDDRVSAWSCGRRNTVESLVRSGWLAADYMPTVAGLVAAGVDMDALHGEALAENVDRQGILEVPNTPRARTFALAVYAGADGTYQAARDILHAEALREEPGEWQASIDAAHADALAEDRARTAGADGTARRADHVLDSVRALTDGDQIVAHPTTAGRGLRAQLAGRALRAPAPEGPYGALAAFADDAARSAPAPTLADEVAALRTEIEAYFLDGNAPKEIATILDRIAGMAPQLAMDANGAVYRMHTPCRRVMIESRSACRYCADVGPWRPLYMLPGDGAA
jgi:hypothetical protein